MTTDELDELFDELENKAKTTEKEPETSEEPEIDVKKVIDYVKQHDKGKGVKEKTVLKKLKITKEQIEKVLITGKIYKHEDKIRFLDDKTTPKPPKNEKTDIDDLLGDPPPTETKELSVTEFLEKNSDTFLKFFKDHKNGATIKEVAKFTLLKEDFVTQCVEELEKNSKLYKTEDNKWKVTDEGKTEVKSDIDNFLDDMIDDQPITVKEKPNTQRTPTKEEPKTKQSIDDILGTDPETETALATTKSSNLGKNDFAKPIRLKDIPQDFMMELGGKPYIKKAGLLWLGKRAGVKSIKVKTIENTWQNGDRRAVYLATVIMKDGGEFESNGIAIGDGKNVQNKMMFRFLDLLAETRAINRALRLATNCGYVSYEELSDFEGDLN